MKIIMSQISKYKFTNLSAVWQSCNGESGIRIKNKEGRIDGGTEVETYVGKKVYITGWSNELAWIGI